jgi:hypothetical protein
MKLILPDMFRTERIRRPPKMPGEIADDVKVNSCGRMRVIATLSFRAVRPAKPHENFEL